MLEYGVHPLDRLFSGPSAWTVCCHALTNQEDLARQRRVSCFNVVCSLIRNVSLPLRAIHNYVRNSKAPYEFTNSRLIAALN